MMPESSFNVPYSAELIISPAFINDSCRKPENASGNLKKTNKLTFYFNFIVIIL